MGFSVSEFYKAFTDALRPSKREITIHRCYECDKVRDDFAQYSVDEVPDNLMNWHQDSIPLLTPKAFRYYLPRYVKYTCDYIDSNAVDNLLFNLSPDDPNNEFWSGRCDEFSHSERKAIVDYLEYRKSWQDAEFDMENIITGLNFWKHE